MLEHITHMMEKLIFPEEAKKFFIDIYKKLSKSDILKIYDIEHRYTLKDVADTKNRSDEENIKLCEGLELEIKKIAEKIGCHKYNLNMIFFLYAQKNS